MVLPFPDENGRSGRERFLSTLISNLPGFVYRCANDPDWTMAYISDGCRGITGYDPADLIGNRTIAFNELIMPEHRDRLWQKWQRLLGTGDVFEEEYTIRTKSGEIRWVWERGRGIFAESGELLFLEGFITDITARKHAEAALAEKTEDLARKSRYYELLLQTSTDAIHVLDREGRLREWNDAFLASLGYSGQEAARLNVADWDAGFPPGEVRARIADLIRRSGRFETLHRRNDGSVFPVEITATAVVVDGEERLYASARDITGRKKAAAALQESEEKYRLVVENSSNAIYIYRNDRILFANRRVTDLTGYSNDELLRMNIWDLVHPEDRTRLQESGKQRISGSVIPPNFTGRIVKKNGDVVDCEFFVNRILFRNQPALLGITRDITEQKKAENALLEIQKKLRTVLDHLPDLVLVHRDGRILYVNPAMTDTLGIRPEDVVQHPVLDYIAPEYHSRVAAAIRERMTTGRDTPYEIELLRREGGRMTVLIRGSVIEFDGAPAILNVLTDVTERRKAERALAESEEKFRSFVENANDIIYSLTPEGIFTYVSPRWTDLLGHASRDIVGKSFDAFIHADDLPACHQFLQETLSTGEKNSGIEYRIRHKDGTWYWHTTTAAPLRDGGGKIVSFLGICRDITDRKHAEEALKASEAKYRAIIENIQDLVYQTDLAGNLTMISPAGARLSGYASPDEMIGLNLERQIYADPCERELFLQELKEKGEVINYPVTLLDRYGTRFHVTASSHFYFDDQGNVLGIEGVLHDVTRQRKAEEALRQANQKLSLLSGVTRHDINNQLLALNGFVALLHSKIPDPVFEPYFSRIATASGQIDAMIQFTREYEEIGVHAPAWQDLCALVNAAGKDIVQGQVALENGIPSGTEVFADPLIVKVFFNLIDNALRHGGGLTTIRFSVTACNGDRIIVCEDDGDGVRNEEKEKIFERGFGRNTGFGLAICREVLGITGITIRETGEPGKGARFEILVPKEAFRSAERKDSIADRSG